MKRLLIAAAMASMAGVSVAVAEAVKVEGCVEPGVEANCLVIKQGEEVFNVTHAEPKPEAGKFGAVEGEVSEEADTCMQGKMLKPSTWTPDETKSCPAADQ